MKAISRTTARITNSPIRKMFNLANSMKDVVNFALGEPDFPTPANIVNAAKRSLDRGETHYTANAGIFPLREAIAHSARQEYGINPDPEGEIIVTAGGMEALLLAMMVLLDPGDEVIISDPYWPNYSRQIETCGGIPRPVGVREENGFIFDPDDLRKAVSTRSKLIILNSPANPTGAVADRVTLEEIARFAIENDLYVISDEVYHHFIYDDVRHSSIASIAGMRERTLVIDSFSKTYAMTGWRVGFAIGPATIIGNMVRYQENFVGSVNTQAQYAAVEALEGSQESLNTMIQTYAERRKLIVEGLNGIEKISCRWPKGAFYCFANIGKLGMKSEDFAMALLKETGTVVVPGSGFGAAGEGFVRMSYATSSENIIKGLERTKAFAEAHRK